MKGAKNEMTDAERIEFFEKRVHELAEERDNWRAACMAEIKNNHELAVKIIKTKITNSTEEK